MKRGSSKLELVTFQGLLGDALYLLRLLLRGANDSISTYTGLLSACEHSPYPLLILSPLAPLPCPLACWGHALCHMIVPPPSSTATASIAHSWYLAPAVGRDP